MSTLNYIDENGNINKVGVIPQNVIDDVTELKASRNWKSLGTKSGTIGGSDFYLQIPSEAKEAVVYVAWIDDLSYVYDFTIADFPNNSRYFARSFSTSQAATIVLASDKKVTVNSLKYNNVVQTTALFTVLWR